MLSFLTRYRNSGVSQARSPSNILFLRTLSEECLVTAKTEDMFRMHNLSIMLCSCVLPVGIDVRYLQSQKYISLFQALNSCISFSGKGYDYVLQQWSNAAMVRLMQTSNQDSSQYQKTADDVENLLSKDAMNEVHRRHPAHALIEVNTRFLL